MPLEQILQDYYRNNAKKLRDVVDRIFRVKYGGTSDKDMDEFYSVANDVFNDIILNNRYDSSKGDFGGFLYRSLELAIIDELKRQNRDKRVQKIEMEVDENGEKKKRKVSVRNVSLDAPLEENNEEGRTYGDVVASEFNYDEEEYSPKVLEYLMRLSNLQRSVLKYTIAGYSVNEIKDLLNISAKQYADCNTAIHSYKNIVVLL